MNNASHQINEHIEKEIKDVISNALNGIEKLEKIYDRLKYTGFLTVVGAFIIVFTVVIAFQTDPDSPNSSFFNVDRVEEVLFIIVGLFLVLLGGSFLALRSVLIYRIEVLKHQIDLTQINLVHKRKMKAFEPETLINKEPIFPKG